MSDASFEGIRGGDGRRRTWRSDIMTTPPPVYESPRWLPPPIASTEGGRRLVSQTLGRRSGCRSYIRGASEEDSDSATERSHASGDFGAV